MERPIVEQVAASKIISTSSTLVYGVWSINSTAGKYLKVYDGVSTDGTLRITLLGSTSQISGIAFNEPVLFASGVYLALESDKVTAMIQFKPLGGKNAEL
jgi:hypothetical protein